MSRDCRTCIYRGSAPEVCRHCPYSKKHPNVDGYHNYAYYYIGHDSIFTAIPNITDVIFNDPATIVFWADGTKTVVKAHNESFDPEKGLAMAIAKKVLGTGYYPEIKKWTKGYEEKAAEQALLNFENSMRRVPEVIAKQPEESDANSIEDGSDSSVNMFDLAREYVEKKYGGE